MFSYPITLEAFREKFPQSMCLRNNPDLWEIRDDENKAIKHALIAMISSPDKINESEMVVIEFPDGHLVRHAIQVLMHFAERYSIQQEVEMIEMAVEAKLSKGVPEPPYDEATSDA